MIGMTRENGCRAIELLGKHDANELMWPGRRAEGKHKVGLFAQGGLVPVRPADGDHKAAPAGVA